MTGDIGGPARRGQKDAISCERYFLRGYFLRADLRFLPLLLPFFPRHSASIAFINDIVVPLRREPLPARSSLMLAKLVTFTVGTISVLFALSIESIIDILI